MNSFQRKSLYIALAGVSAVGATAAEAVNVNPNGLGEALIYPYYTDRASPAGNNFNSLLTVVNSTDSVMVVKVRYLEGQNSREVIDFNLYLSPFDVWTSGVIPSPATAGGRLLVVDHSCTVPPISTSQGGAGFVDFVNYGYTGSNSDGGTSSLDRSNEGYVEIIEMGTFTSTDTVAIAATHVNGTPPCTPAAFSDANNTNEIFSNVTGLFGGMTLINVNDGTDYTEDAVALDNFSGGGSNAARGGYTSSGTNTPNLENAINKFGVAPSSQVLANGNVYTSNWAIGTADAVSATLMHNNVMNFFVLDPTTKSGSDWVVTEPTKHFYISPGTGPASGKIFQRNFNDSVGSCDDVELATFDREEFKVVKVSFSPPPPTGVNDLCWEANIITFNNSNVLGSTNSKDVNTSFLYGWARLTFFDPLGLPSVKPTIHQLINTNTAITTIGGTTTAGNTVTYLGLPVVGFEVESYTNGNLVVGGTTVLSNYGGNFVHKTTTDVLPLP